VIISETETFKKFLEAMCEYGDISNDLVVKKLVEDIYKDLPGKQRPGTLLYRLCGPKATPRKFIFSRFPAGM